MLSESDVSAKEAIGIVTIVVFFFLFGVLYSLLGCVTTQEKEEAVLYQTIKVRKWRCNDGKLYQMDRIGGTNAAIDDFCKSRDGVKSYNE